MNNEIQPPIMYMGICMALILICIGLLSIDTTLDKLLTELKETKISIHGGLHGK